MRRSVRLKRRSPQRTQPLKLADVQDSQDTLGQISDSLLSQSPQNPTHMDRGQSGRIGDVLLTQRKWVLLIADHVVGSDTPRQLEKEVGDPLFCRTPPQNRG